MAAAVARSAVFWLMPPGQVDSKPYWIFDVAPPPIPPAPWSPDPVNKLVICPATKLL